MMPTFLLLHTCVWLSFSPFFFIIALTVRYLTKRFITEYGSTGELCRGLLLLYYVTLNLLYSLLSENRYKHEALIDGDPVLFEILDSCPKVFVQIFNCFRFRRNDTFIFRRIWWGWNRSSGPMVLC